MSGETKIASMGAIPHAGGVGFCVRAPNAQRVSVIFDNVFMSLEELDFSERESHAEAYALHRDLLKLRREDPAFRAQRPGGVDGAVLSPKAFVLCFFEAAGDDRLLLVNFGTDV